MAERSYRNKKTGVVITVYDSELNGENWELITAPVPAEKTTSRKTTKKDK